MPVPCALGTVQDFAVPCAALLCSAVQSYFWSVCAMAFVCRGLHGCYMP